MMKKYKINLKFITRKWLLYSKTDDADDDANKTNILDIKYLIFKCI